MIWFKWYGKIHRIGKDETDGLFQGVCTIQEKVDGANLSIWSEDGEIFVGSRTQIVWNKEIKTWFRGAVEYANASSGIREFFKKFPSHRMYWEWLVPHTITSYNAENYSHFYLFDIEQENWDRFSQNLVKWWANELNIRTPHTFAVITNPTIDNILEFVGKSTLGPIGEWVVVKNENFVNKFWDKCYGKIVSDEFKEDNAIVFGNAASKDVEMELVSKFISLERIKKIMNKIEQNEDVDIGRPHMAKIIGMTYYDFLQEEVMAVAKCGIVNFKRLNSLSTQKIARIALDIIDWNATSVAFNQE
jgi:hypothetical protein